jgi:uncharacterized protein DUF2760
VYAVPKPIFGFARAGDSGYAPAMERNEAGEKISFGARLALGVRVLFNPGFAGRVAQALQTLEAKPAAAAPEQLHASSLLLLGALQREGRLLDFLQQEVAGFSDDQVGAAARVVHGGCRKVLLQYFEFEAVAKEPEGTELSLPKGFDPQRWRLTGNVAGQPPFRGTVRHHGWVTKEIRMPAVSESLDPRIVAPAEIEIP